MEEKFQACHYNYSVCSEFEAECFSFYHMQQTLFFKASQRMHGVQPLAYTAASLMTTLQPMPILKSKSFEQTNKQTNNK
jgi:hypothetical protein